MQSFERRDRRRGNVVLGVLLVLVLVALGLGGNYIRNARTDEQQEKKARPYAMYAVADLELLAEGYRAEVSKLEGRHGAGRVATRTRHHFSDQVQEFERVQKAARRSRDKSGEIAQLRGDLQKVEAELAHRAASATGFDVYLERMFRF